MRVREKKKNKCLRAFPCIVFCVPHITSGDHTLVKATLELLAWSNAFNASSSSFHWLYSFMACRHEAYFALLRNTN